MFVIIKNGYYYRKNSCGYTAYKNEAETYTLEEVALRFPNVDSPDQDGMSFMLVEDAPENYNV